MNLSFSTRGWLDVSWEENIQTALDMRFGGIELVNEAWLANPMSEVLSLVVYSLLVVYLVKASMKVR